MPHAPQPVVLTYLRLCLTAIFWGGTFVAGRLVAQDLPPLTAAAARFTLAAALLLTVLRLQDGRLPRCSPKQWFGLTLLGLTGVFLYNLCFFTGLRSIEAGRGAMIIAANPVVITVLAMLLFGERFDFGRLIGAMISVGGALVVVSHGHLSGLFEGQIGRGELWMLGCVLSWAAYALIGKKMLRSVSPLVAVTLSCSIGAILLVVATLILDGSPRPNHWSLVSWLSLIYLALFGTALAFIWFYQGVHRLGAGRASLFVNLVPVSGITFGILLLGERPDTSLYAGGALVLAGLFLVNHPVGAAWKT